VIRFLIGVAGFLMIVAKTHAVDHDRLLRAIAEVETANNPRAVGRAGERTIYQIAPGTWRGVSRVPMARASAAEIDAVARTILADIHLALRERKIPVTPYEIALRWNAGARARRFTPATRDYAQRVANIYHAEAHAVVGRD
jgi:soluble lytic murein transglycosylase-like protein